MPAFKQLAIPLSILLSCTVEEGGHEKIFQWLFVYPDYAW
jgi:hypothetical protein